MTRQAEPVTFTTNPEPRQIEEAADLIDAHSRRHRPFKRERLHTTRVIALALDDCRRVIGVGVLRKLKGNVAEGGYFAVDPAYRRRGIGQRLL